MASVHTHTETFTQRRFDTHTEAFTHKKLLHREAFTHSKLLQKKVFTQRSFLVHNHNRNCSSKSGSRRQSEGTTILNHFSKGLLKGKLRAPKSRKSADKSLSQPWCSHSKTIYEIQLHKTIVLRMQPRHQATLTQPLQCDLQPQIQETHTTTEKCKVSFSGFLPQTKLMQHSCSHYNTFRSIT